MLISIDNQYDSTSFSLIFVSIFSLQVLICLHFFFKNPSTRRSGSNVSGTSGETGIDEQSVNMCYNFVLASKIFSYFLIVIISVSSLKRSFSVSSSSAMNCL